MDAEQVSAELEAYPKLAAAMDVMTQSLVGIMTPHLPPENGVPSKVKTPSRRAKMPASKAF